MLKTVEEFEVELDGQRVIDITCDTKPLYGGVAIIRLMEDGTIEVDLFGQDQDGGDHQIFVENWFSDDELHKLVDEHIEGKK